MEIKFYNTLTKQKEVFKPLEGNTVRIYSCGPTVYKDATIGNMRTFIFMDNLRRVLKYNGYELKHAMNITDVGHLVSDGDEGEDKMLKSAREEGKTPLEISEFYTKRFLKDFDRLNIDRPEIICKATEHIQEMLEFVEKLMENGYAYETSTAIYFDVSKLDKYGILSGIDLRNQMAGARVEVDEEKRNPYDFALWIKAPENHLMKWDSPWGPSYPGWHIECSAIAVKHLGERLDLHCGGIDNAFPHHTNEIAQSEAYLGHKWCNYWFHVHHLNTENGKMSKSKGEFLTVSLLEQKGYDPLVYRLFCLQSHYRRNLVFSWENLDNAAVTYRKIAARVAALGTEGTADEAALETLREKFRNALSADLNTSLAVTAVYDVLKADTNDATKRAALADFDRVLGLDLLKAAEKLKAAEPAEECDPEIDALVAERAQAKKEKNWAHADEIRDRLRQRGIEIIDTPQGAKWKRV